MIQNKYYTINSIKPLVIILNIICFCPPFDFDKNAFTKPSYKYYPYLTISVLFLIFVYSLQGRIFQSYENLEPIVVLIDIISFVAIHILNVFSIINITCWKSNKVKSLFVLFAKIDDILLRKPKSVNIKLYFKMLSYHTLIFLFVALDIKCWNETVGFKILKFYCIRYFQYYFLFTVSFTISIIGNKIKSRFDEMNEVLISLINYKSKILYPVEI